jgi:hypothetical protein
MSISDIILLSIVPAIWVLFVLRAWRGESKAIWKDNRDE